MSHVQFGEEDHEESHEVCQEVQRPYTGSAEKEEREGREEREGVAGWLRVYLSHVVLTQQTVRSLRDVLCFMGATRL